VNKYMISQQTVASILDALQCEVCAKCALKYVCVQFESNYRAEAHDVQNP
jgi:hypothetical protein